MEGLHIISLFCVCYVSACYDGRYAGLTEVPHASILSNETVINLSQNEITELAANEFSAYHDLEAVTLVRNEIHTISPSAFNGTKLRILNLRNNKLTAIPDFALVSTTLKSLNLKKNRLTAFPNVTMNGNIAKLLLQNNSEILEHKIYTVCQIGSLEWTNSDLQRIPNFTCEISYLHRLELQYNKLSEYSDLTGLESISSSLQTLVLRNNKFTQFPNLSTSVRMNLRYLHLDNNQISVIPGDVATGYNLTSLLLNNNLIMLLPSGFLSTSHEINLAYNPLSDWDQYKWNDMMCGAALSLQSLDLSGSMSSLAQMPDVHYSICHPARTHMLNLTLESIPGPCDCSVQWMADALHQECLMELKTDVLQCNLALEDLNLTCPETGMVLYHSNNFSGYSFLVAIGGHAPAPMEAVKSIAVLGDQAWIVKSLELLYNTQKTLLPRRYASLYEAGISFGAFTAEPYTPTLYVPHDPTLFEETCLVDDTLKLFDDDLETCLTIEGVLWLPVASDEPIYELIVTTRDMNCSKRFHVSVSVVRPVEECNEADVGQLVYSSYFREGSVEFSECVYAVPQGDRDIMIRLASVHMAWVCSITHARTGISLPGY